MTIDEIFSTLLAHMRKGLMIHDQISTQFAFLNLPAYQKEHRKHLYEETRNYRRLYDFYISNYEKLVPEGLIETPNLIPSNWYNHERIDVDTNTKRTAIRNIIKSWVDWETETKTLLETSYKSLYGLGEIRAAIEIGKYIEEVSAELQGAHEKYISLESIGYDMVTIEDEQKKYNEDDD